MNISSGIGGPGGGRTSGTGDTGGGPATPIADEDIYAFRPLPHAAPPGTPPRRRRRWPWVLLVCAALTALLALAGALAVTELFDSAREGLHVTINGHRWDPFLVGPEHAVLALLAVAATLFVLLMVLPIVLMVVLAVLLLAIALVFGSGLLAVVLVAAVALSPLWLLGLLMWLLLRRRAAQPTSARLQN